MLSSLLIWSWMRSGSPDHGWRFRLICWLWYRDDQRTCPPYNDADEATEPPF